MNVTLTVEQSGLRADQYLAGVLDGLTRSAAQKLLEAGQVRIGEKSPSCVIIFSLRVSSAIPVRLPRSSLGFTLL